MHATFQLIQLIEALLLITLVLHYHLYSVVFFYFLVTGTITSCLVASVPYEFEKPVQPLTKFQLERKTETEGKVKILLQNQKVRTCLSSLRKLIFNSTFIKCIHLVPNIGQ